VGEPAVSRNPLDVLAPVEPTEGRFLMRNVAAAGEGHDVLTREPENVSDFTGT
jgi:hypothetical protein